MSISYCISVCDESIELNTLLNQLLPGLDDILDEVIILVDVPKVTAEVGKVIGSYKTIYPFIKVIEGNLNNDFSSFKNEFVKTATKDYLFQIDADELLNEEMFISFKSILEFNPTVDMFSIGRENYVSELTQEYIQKWGWRVDEKGRINYFDPQQRIFKNYKGIKWQNKVHEVLVNYKTFATLPLDYYLIHNKTLERQIKQNLLYEQIL